MNEVSPKPLLTEPLPDGGRSREEREPVLPGPPQPFRDMVVALPSLLASILKFAFMTLALLVLIGAVTTISERQDLAGIIRAEMLQAQAEIARTLPGERNARVPQPLAEFPPAAPGAAPQQWTRLDYLTRRLDELTRAAGAIRAIQLSGESWISTPSISRAVLASIPDIQLDAAPAVGMLHGYGAMLATLSDDFLLFICTILGCAIGAFAAGLRNRATSSMQDIFLGCLSGLFTLLSIKGGQAFIFRDYAEIYARFNPFSIAFTAVVVGLFTERVYQLVSRLFAKLESAVERSVGADGGAPRPARAPEKPGSPAMPG
jgi:hypothetical protein